MLGAIIGDVAGSRFEWDNIKSKDFELLARKCKPTDDSVLTLAVAQAILDCEGDYSGLGDAAVRRMREFGRRYPHAGYGGGFRRWLRAEKPAPYRSWGNGSAMRVSPCGFSASSISEAIALSKAVTEVTHNHPEGVKGAEAIAVAIFLARSGESIEGIRNHIESYYYEIDFTLDEIRPSYTFDVSCRGSVPQAFEAFFESTSFEDAIRNAISIGGDSDTIAAIAGSVAEAYYGVPDDLRSNVLAFLDEDQKAVVEAFEAKFGVR